MGHDFSADYQRLDFLEEENRRLQERLGESAERYALASSELDAQIAKANALESKLDRIRAVMAVPSDDLDDDVGKVVEVREILGITI